MRWTIARNGPTTANTVGNDWEVIDRDTGSEYGALCLYNNGFLVMQLLYRMDNPHVNERHRALAAMKRHICDEWKRLTAQDPIWM